MGDALEYVRQQNGDVAGIQTEVSRNFDKIGGLGTATELVQVSIGTVETKVAHCLPWAPSNAEIMVGPPNVDARIWCPRAPDMKFVYLQASAACKANVWIARGSR